MEKRQPLLAGLIILWMMMTNLFGQVPEMMQPPRLVNDYIGLLPENDLLQIENQLVQFDNETSIQVAVVIIQSTNGTPISDMATQIGESWGVGQKGLDNGVVFLFAINDRKMNIATGYGVEEYLPDAMCSNICNETVRPFFKDENYPAGIKAGVDRIVKILGSMSWEDREAQKQALKEQERQRRQDFFENTLLVLALIMIILLVIYLYRKQLKRQKDISEKKEEIRRMEEYLRKILDDEVVLDQNWPTWAKTEYEQHFPNYQALHKECEEALRGLPTRSNAIYKLNYETLNQIRNKLTEFDEVDREVTKIREDVKGYQKRAPQALKEAGHRLQGVREQVVNMSTHHSMSDQLRELDHLQDILTDLRLDTPDDYRRTFEKSFGVSQKLKLTQAQLKEEEGIRQELTKEKPYLETSLSKEVPGWNAEYGKVYGQINENFSGFSIEGLLTPAVLNSLFNQAKRRLEEASRMMSSQTVWKYSLAQQSFQKSREDHDEINSALTLIKERLQEIFKIKESFTDRRNEAAKIVKEAKTAIKNSDVGRKAREIVRSAITEFEKAESLAKIHKPDWIGVEKGLELAEELAKKAIKKAKRDISEAREGYSSNRSTRSSSSSIGFSSSGFGGGSSSGSFGGGFGGFGGGSFGGDGGGGSW